MLYNVHILHSGYNVVQRDHSLQLYDVKHVQPYYSHVQSTSYNFQSCTLLLQSLHNQNHVQACTTLIHSQATLVQFCITIVLSFANLAQYCMNLYNPNADIKSFNTTCTLVHIFVNAMYKVLYPCTAMHTILQLVQPLFSCVPAPSAIQKVVHI